MFLCYNKYKTKCNANQKERYFMPVWQNLALMSFVLILYVMYAIALKKRETAGGALMLVLKWLGYAALSVVGVAYIMLLGVLFSAPPA